MNAWFEMAEQMKTWMRKQEKNKSAVCKNRWK